MAHQLKYYKEIESHGHLWCVEILQETEDTLTPMEIGPVLQSLRLVMQGDQADVDTPIVKTSMEMIFIDAPDLEKDRKCGFWEEFYTSSATEYKVQLYKDDILEWSGYITPDSFSEDLRYRGSVSIIARDNIGTLQDTTCDLRQLQNMDGKVYLFDLIDKAKEICNLDMAVEWNQDAFPYGGYGIYERSGLATWQMIDTRAVQDMNWWEALEAVLYSIGAVMRYVGGNTFRIMPLRDMPKYGESYWWDVPVRDVRFLSYGHRELVPGIKSIIEEQEFEDPDDDNDIERVGEYEGRATLQLSNILYKYPDGTNAGPNMNVPANGYTNIRTREKASAANSGLIDARSYPKVKKYDMKTVRSWDDEGTIYMAVNNIAEKTTSFSKTVYSADDPVKIGFTLGGGIAMTADYTKVLNLPISGFNVVPNSAVFKFRITHRTSAGVISYYDVVSQEWSSSSVINQVGGSSALDFQERTHEFEIAVPSAGTVGLELIQWSIFNVNIYVLDPIIGLFGRVSDIHIDIIMPEELDLVKKCTITTNYSDRYAVRLSRSPKFAVNPTTQKEVALIPNALLTEAATEHTYMGASDWQWMHGKEPIDLPEYTGISLTGLIHQQILAYHAKPNNVLSGELSCEDPVFNAIYQWQGRDHYLISGTLNVLTGRMENAVLREYMRYDHMWETWVEIEDYNLDNRGGEIEIRLHTNTEVESDIWGDSLPSWLTPVGHIKISTGLYILDARVMANGTGEIRMAYIQLDTALIRITQQG